MSATLKHDIGQAIRDLLQAVSPDDVMSEMGLRGASRWAGYRRASRGQRYECVTFSLRLPRDMAKAWKFYRLVSVLQVAKPGASPVTKVAISGCHVLASKFLVSLGLPAYVATGDELGFLASIDKTPGELSTWGVYADWLQDRDDPAQQRRGLHIVNVLAKKALKMSYGTPFTHFGDPGELYEYKTFPNYKHLERRDYIGESLAGTIPGIFEDLK